MLAWRGKEELTVGKLLVCLWQKEEAHMAVSRDSNGGISGKLEQYKQWLECVQDARVCFSLFHH